MTTSQESGYECKFVDNVKDYECPLCLHVTRDPNLTSCCGQHFCCHCIQTILSNNKPCPFCKENGFNTFLDKKQKRRILNLKVYCKNKASCDWKGSLGELEQHLSEKCLYVSVNCSYNCGEARLRLHLKQHQSKHCPNRPHSCKHCQLEGTYQDIKENHIPVCPKYPVSCPNKCEVSSLQRDQLEEHLTECLLAMVECDLREVGCEEKLQRKDLDRHMEEAARKHLRLSTSYFMKNQRRQDKEIAKLQQENEILRKELTELVCEVTPYSKNIEISADFPTLHSLAPRWINDNSFQTFLGCTMKINLFMYNACNRLEIELTHTKSAMDNSLKWPMIFSMKVKLLNQMGDNGHHEVRKENLQVERGGTNDQVHIEYSVIENPPPGAQYIVNGQIKMKITVVEK